MKEKALFRAAVYIRLSKEDGDKEESDSVGNQKRLLTEFIKTRHDIVLYDTYIEMKIAKMIQFENMNPRQKARNKGF